MPENEAEVYQNPYDDPLYLSQSDYPSMKLTDTIFNGKNYSHWSRSVLLGLSSKNKQGFVTGGTPRPDATSPKLQQWLRCDSMVRCWILYSIAGEIKVAFTLSKTARSLWIDVQERYGQSNGPLLFQLKKEIRNISQDGDSVAEYFTKLKRRWDDVEEIEAFPECSCGIMEKCSCNILKKILEAASKEKLIAFLMGLNNSYEHLRTNILSMEPLPNINKAYSILQQVGSQKSISLIQDALDDASALNAAKQDFSKSGGSPGAWNVWKRDGKKPKLNDRVERWCYACNKAGHTPNTCFMLHPELRTDYMARKAAGFQKQYNGYNGNNGAAGFQKQYNGPNGYKGSKFMANAAEVYEDTPLDAGISQSSVASTSRANDYPQVDPALVSAIYQQVMQAIHSNKDVGPSMDYNTAAVNFAGIILATNVVSDITTSAHIDWILDSGATDHMTAHKSLFPCLKLLPKPVLIGLPDGSTKVVKHFGDIQVSPEIVLKDVLYVPEFQHNLLSIGKLISCCGMRVLFDNYQCVIRDWGNKAVVACQKEGGLYKFKQHEFGFGQKPLIDIRNNDNSRYLSSNMKAHLCSTSNGFACSKIDRCVVHSKLELMHARLGHTSNVKMQHIPLINKEDVKNYVCETCIMAKLHKMSFERDYSRASHIFDLIHIDLWGPYKIASITGAHYFLTIVDDHSRVTWTFLLNNKEQVPSTIDTFLAHVYTQYGLSVKRVRSDNGTEIIQEFCIQLFAKKGILHQKSLPGVPSTKW
ncbi:uncharacterized protein LOC141654888 [Silene latifolia]|uniref:uncharacterized protein LOC141654888 n=1 Tax=Silene latifolia TaxID=37657 RepID=UPI003D76D8BB